MNEDSDEVKQLRLEHAALLKTAKTAQESKLRAEHTIELLVVAGYVTRERVEQAQALLQP